MSYKTIKSKITGFFNPVVDVTAKALSYPARAAAQSSIDKSNQLYNDIKMVRKAKGVSTAGKDYNDPLFRAQANVAAAKAARMK